MVGLNISRKDNVPVLWIQTCVGGCINADLGVADYEVYYVVAKDVNWTCHWTGIHHTVKCEPLFLFNLCTLNKVAHESLNWIPWANASNSISHRFFTVDKLTGGRSGGKKKATFFPFLLGLKC